MNKKRIKCLGVLAVAGLCCLMSGLAMAQDNDTGIVRITDNPVNLTPVQQVKCVDVKTGCVDNGCLDGASCCPTNGCPTDGCTDGACLNGCCNGKCKPGACGNGQCNGQCGGKCQGACQNGICPSGCRSCGCQNGACQGAASGCPGCPNCNGYAGYGCPHYGNGTCPLGMLLPVSGGCGTGCGPCGGKLSNSFRRLMAIIDPCSGACTHSPSHGFVPPGEPRPYFRQPVSYQHNYPASWMGGTPGQQQRHHPAVYMPTDTTQLGYYYQRVPAWAPVPGMIPPAPQPAQWHVFGNAVQYSTVETVPTPSSDDSDVEAGEEAPEPPSAMVPPLPQANSGSLEKSALKPQLMPITR